ncbi:hypothetical protein [Halopseudomonas pertucinogena]|uniref:hypothetical protein n=1 Tax=Halopseudomonas pertucinogena TaxID=86175 RepID=UPI0016693F5E|nr:hypothetical protein [Halopseudomonas pertucinogena]
MLNPASCVNVGHRRPVPVEVLSAIILLLLFPGFYLYHQGVAAGHIPGFLGGFFSPVCLLALIAYIPFYKGVVKRAICVMPSYSCCILFFLVWATAVALITRWFYPEYYMQEALMQYLNIAMLWVALMALGSTLDLEIIWFRRCLWVSGVVIVFMLIAYVISTGSLLFYAASFYDAEEGVASYQGFARSALILCFALLAISTSITQQVLVTIGSVFVLFVLSARSEFAAVIFSMTMLYMVRSKSEPKKLAVVGLAVAALSVLIANFSGHMLQSRQANILNLGSDNSWTARQDLKEEAWARIERSPILGQFGGHFESGGAGSGPHNIISVWDSFGLVGFVLFLLLALIPAADAVRQSVKYKYFNSYQTFYFLVSISVGLLLLTAKSHLWPVTALAWGLCVSGKRMTRNAR